VIRASLAIAALVAVASPPARAQPRQDAIDRPTDTHVALVAGLWHDDVLKPGYCSSLAVISTTPGSSHMSAVARASHPPQSRQSHQAVVPEAAVKVQTPVL
jgi:hypothetical protein